MSEEVRSDRQARACLRLRRLRTVQADLQRILEEDPSFTDHEIDHLIELVAELILVTDAEIALLSADAARASSLRPATPRTNADRISSVISAVGTGGRS